MLLDTLRETIVRYRMRESGDRVVVGVSGGADSVALLYALHSLKQALGISVVAAHLNHSTRGAESDEDARFVEALASEMGVECVVGKVNVPALQREMRVGLEEAARKARYEFLERTADECGASKIAVAHTSDDRVETVLLNIIRGTGTDGLAGIPPLRGRIIRPLLGTSRAEVEEYLQSQGASWRTDASNAETSFARNRVRHQLIPMLRREFNPRATDAILSLSEIAAAESEYVASQAQAVYDQAVLTSSPGAVELNAAVVASQPPAIVRRCVRAAIEAVKGDLLDIEFEQVERIAAHLQRREPATLTLPPGDVYAAITTDSLRVSRRQELPRPDVCVPLVVPGRTELPELGLTIETRFVGPDVRPASSNEAVVDTDKLHGTLIARTWRDGDRMVPFGMHGHKKLQDIFTDRKVPRESRGLVPVVADSSQIVWVAGVVASDTVKVTETSTRALLLIQITP